MMLINPIDANGHVVVPSSRPSAIETIALEVAAKHRVTVTDLRSQRRDKLVVPARQEAFWRSAKETTLSLPQIGRYFGDRDHTTVIHGIRKHEQRMAEVSKC